MYRKNSHPHMLDSLVTGDEKGIVEIYKAMYPSVLSYVRKNGGTEDDARDIFQKALLQLIVRVQVSGFCLERSFEGYFFVVCKNLWIKEVKMLRAKVANHAYLDHVSEERDIALGALEQEKWDLFQEKLSNLSENCRKVLSEVFKKVPYTQIALKLGYSSENVVRQRVYKCKAKLREAIHKDSRYREMKRA